MVNVALTGSQLTLNTARVDTLVLDGLTVNAAGDLLAGWDLNPFNSPDLPDPQSEGEDLAIKLFSPTLSAIKSEFDPAAFVLEGQSNLQVAALTNGAFVVAFQSQSASLGETGNFDSIRALIVSASGTVTTSELLVNATNDGNLGNLELPAVTALASGGFVVTWTDTQTLATVGQAFSASGAKVGAETTVNVNTNMAGASEVAALQNGDFVVAWQQDSVDPTGAKLALQLYSPSFTAIGGPLSLNGASSQQEAHVVGLSDGRFVAVWDDEVTSGSGASTTETRHVMAQFFTSAGAQAGSAFVVESQDAGLGYLTGAAALDNGDFAAVWTSFSGAAESLHLQIIAPDGSKVGSEQIVATGAPGEILGDASIANLGGGKLLVAWDDQASASAYVAVKSQEIAYGATAPSPTLASLDTAFANVLLADPASSLATTPTITLADGSSVANPIYQNAQNLAGLAAQVDGGQTTLAAALSTVEHYGDSTTSVATIAYEFFTNATPSAGGYAYLINSAANPDDLNSAYYAKFNEENRYINFAVNLGKAGAGESMFTSGYGSLDLADAMTKAYTAIFGFAPAAGKIDTILTAEVGTNETRADYFAAYGLDGANGQGTKAAAIGWLMVEAVEADTGTYAQANDLFLSALANGTAQYNIDLLSVYGAQPPAGQSSLGTTYTGALSAGQTTNVYQFELTAGERYEFVMSGAGTGSTTLHFPALAISGPGGVSLAPTQASSAAPYMFDFTPATSGVYTVTAETLGGGSGSYSLVGSDIRGAAQVFESVGLAGATFGGAAPVGTLAPGGPVHISGAISGGILQIYQFSTPAAGAQVELDASAPSGLQLTLLDSGFNVVGHANASNAGYEQIVANLSGGAYYLELSNPHAAPVNYDLHFWG